MYLLNQQLVTTVYIVIKLYLELYSLLYDKKKSTQVRVRVHIRVQVQRNFLRREKDETTIETRKESTHELLHKPYWKEREKEVRMSDQMMKENHELRAVAAHKIFCGSMIVNSQWKYASKQCVKYKSKCRTYCSCSPGIHLCKQCFTLHVSEEETKNENRDRIWSVPNRIFFDTLTIKLVVKYIQ